jgi:hypothetical protein
MPTLNQHPSRIRTYLCRWRQVNGEWQLFCRNRLVARVVSEPTWVGMRCVVPPDDSVSDVANPIWAKDAARSQATRKKPPGVAAVAQPIAQNDHGAMGVAA